MKQIKAQTSAQVVLLGCIINIRDPTIRRELALEFFCERNRVLIKHPSLYYINDIDLEKYNQPSISTCLTAKTFSLIRNSHRTYIYI